MKRTQHKNALLTAQIDQFKIEYKLKIDQMKAEITALSSSSRSSDSSVPHNSGDSNCSRSLPPDAKDKKLNELERTVNALLRKMTEVGNSENNHKNLVSSLKSMFLDERRE